MLDLWPRIKHLVGLDRAIGFTLVNQLIQATYLPISIYLVGTRLNPEEQGYFYTFSSLIAMQILFELGFGQCVVQFASHEMAHLSFGKRGALSGPENAKSRLISLCKLSTRWFFVAAIGFFVVVGSAGTLFFQKNSGHGLVNWMGPWWLLCATTAILLAIQPFLSLLEGCNQIAWLAKLRAFASSARIVVFAGTIFLGMGLYSVGLAAGVYVVVIFVGVCIYWVAFIRQILVAKNGSRMAWRAEIWPLQWRVALTWLGGFLSFTLLNPIIFHICGPVEAGRFGMTWSLIQALVAFAIAWNSTKVPQYGMLIANEKFAELDFLWWNATARSLVASTIGGIGLIGAAIVVQTCSPFGTRFLPWNATILLVIATIINQWVFSQALYLRAHKKEPFLVYSIAMGGVTAVMAFVFTGFYQTFGTSLAFLIASGLGSIWATYIFIVCRQKWHGVEQKASPSHFY